MLSEISFRWSVQAKPTKPSRKGTLQNMDCGLWTGLWTGPWTGLFYELSCSTTICLVAWLEREI